MAEFTPQTNQQAPTALDLRSRLGELLLERALAEVEGLHLVDEYMSDLDHEIEATKSAWVGMAVTEMATLRAELFGAQQG